jgi:WhiB family redox-sensing transcriptional regulator
MPYRLAPASAEAWDWRLKARCRSEDPNLFFHPDGERGSARKHRQQLANRVCADCPVIRHCRDHSIWYQEAFGTWGGLSEDERVRFLQDHAINIRTHRHRSPRSDTHI